jgi:hypothetical protein
MATCRPLTPSPSPRPPGLRSAAEPCAPPSRSSGVPSKTVLVCWGCLGWEGVATMPCPGPLAAGRMLVLKHQPAAERWPSG